MSIKLCRNDNPIEYIYYKALAEIRLGNKDIAESIKKSFYRYYDTHIGKKVLIDYFAVSLPDLLVWEQDLDKRNDKFCHYIKDLADSIITD